MKNSRRAAALASIGALVASLMLGVTSASQSSAAGWCSGVKISYFKGGTADSFSDILEKGARAAAADTGADVTIVSSGWDFPKMVQQFKEEIVKKPDAISFMGHPGDAAILSAAKMRKQREFSSISQTFLHLSRLQNLTPASSVQTFQRWVKHLQLAQSKISA